MLVLSYMNRAVKGNRRQARVRRILERKARRAARLILPDVLLLSAGNRDTSTSRAAMTKAALSSPLLPQSRDKACSDLQGTDGFEFEYLVACLWFPLTAKDAEMHAAPLASPRRVSMVQTRTSNYTMVTFNGKDKQESDATTVDPVHGAPRSAFLKISKRSGD